MKRYWIIIVLSLLFTTGVALAAGATQPDNSRLSQDPTPTAAHQIFIPGASGGEGSGQASASSAPGESLMSYWWLCLVGLVVLGAFFIVVRAKARG